MDCLGDSAQMKATRRLILILFPILAAVCWCSFGQQKTMLREARNARTREDVRNFRLNYPINPSQSQGLTVKGFWVSRCDLFHTHLYDKRHSFTWRFDTSAEEGEVVSYSRTTETVILGMAHIEDESR